MLTQFFNEIHHNVVKQAPKLFAFPSQFIPFVVQQKCLSEMLNRIFREAIEEGDVDFLAGKWLKVRVTDLPFTWFLSLDKNAIIIKEVAPTTDVAFSATANDLILVIGRKEDPDTLFFQRRLSIEGDTELGLEVKNLLDNIEFEHLPAMVQKAIIHFSHFVQSGIKATSPTMAT